MFWIKEQVLPEFRRIIAEVAEVLPKFENGNGNGITGLNRKYKRLIINEIKWQNHPSSSAPIIATITSRRR